MTSLWFAHPAWLLPGVALLVLLGAALLAAFALARRRARVLLGRGTLGKSAAIRDATFWCAALALVTAGLGPRLTEQTVQVTSSGVDLVVLVDVSRSMDAADVAPSRLDRARRAAQEILGRMPPESRSALAAFAGRGVLFTPLTPDHQALAEMLPAVETGLIRPGGSSLALGVEAAVSAYEEGSERPRVLFVLSDGESRSASGGVDEALLQRASVRVLAAPQGSPLGATIPDYGTPLRDSAGEIVVSRRHDEPLVRLSEISGGTVFLPDEWGEFDVDAAMAAIHRDVLPRDGGFVERAVTVPVVVPFAGIAFVLLLLEAASGSRWPGRRRARRAAGSAIAWGSQRGLWRRSLRVALLLPALLLAGADAGPETDPAESPGEPSPADTIAALEAQAQRRGLDAVELVTLGVARAATGLVDEADQAFRAAALQADEPAVAARAYHDLGVSALARGELEVARDAFFDALALAAEAGQRGTKTDETRFNLEWTLAALSPPDREEPPPPLRPRPDDSGEREKPKDREEPQPDAAEPEIDPAAQPAQADPSAQPEPEGAEAPPSGPAGMSSDDTRRWLERVEDDPARALRSATQPTGRTRRHRGPGPTW